MPGLEDPDCYTYENKDYFELPARFVWSLSHYDGPMTAIAKYKGDYYYAKCHQSSETRNDRFFWLYPLTAVETAKEMEYQDWFREYIGFHCDYDKFGKRSKKPENWKEWWWEKSRSFKKNPHTYSSKQKELKIDREEYTKREAIGFFTRYTRYKERVYS